jgi:hypothetical protein
MLLNSDEDNKRCVAEFGIGIGKFIFIELEGEKKLYSGLIKEFTKERTLVLQLSGGRFGSEKSITIPFNSITKTY